MHGVDLTRFAVGIVGNVISGLLFVSPWPTYWRIIKKKSTEEFHPYPYLATVMNCLLWVFYGIVTPDSILVITINGFGLVMELIYLVVFFTYTGKKYRKHIVALLVIEAVAIGVIAAITMLVIHNLAGRSMLVGILSVIFGTIMYGSPLSVVWKVYKTKSAEFLPIWLCLAGFVNGIVWFTYANLKTFDYYIAIGNGVGAILGLIQLGVWAFYTLRARGKKGKESDVKPSEVELENTKLPPV